MYLVDRSNTTEKSVECGCMKNCETAFLYIVQKTDTGPTGAFTFDNILSICLLDHPIIRYKRQIIFTFTDLLGEFLGFQEFQ